MTRGTHPADPRGLIEEAYRMDVTPADCRAIFLDWALGQPDAGRPEVAALLAHFGPLHPDHPMTAVLREGLEGPGRPSRSGRRRH